MTEMPIKYRPTKELKALKESITETLREGFNAKLKQTLEEVLDELWVRRNIESITGRTWEEFNELMSAY